MLYQAAYWLVNTLPIINAFPTYYPDIIQQVVTDPLVTRSTLRDTLLDAKIIPQVLDDFEPLYYIDVSYPKHHERVLMGNDIPVKSVDRRPSFTFHPIERPPSDHEPEGKHSTFTLALTDPDALSYDNPVKSEMCHWLLTNLTTPLHMPFILDETAADELEHAMKRLVGEIEPYYPPAPPKKTGPHRYVFVLLRGDASGLTTPKERPHWGYGKERHGVRDWSKENGLTVVGANFFYAQHKKQ